MMKDHQRRFTDDNPWNSVPPGVNPFQFSIDRSAHRGFAPLSRLTKALLLVFFVFHLLIAIFCLIILVLPYIRGVKQSHWFFRKLYIQDQSRQKVYKVPLLWVNGGVVMTMSQLMGSVATLAYILIQLAITQSINASLHVQVEPALAMMCMCEMLTYWSQMHCFVVAMFYHNHKTDSNGPKRWTPPPIFINCLFLGFPMVLVIATLPPVIGLSLNHNQITIGVTSIMNTLRQGASVWDQLKVPSTTIEEKHELTTQLNQIMSQLKDLGVHIGIHAERLKVCFDSFIWVMLVLLCITFLFFIVVFGVLVQKVQQAEEQSACGSSASKPFRRWFNLKNHATTSGVEPKDRSDTGEQTSIMNRQFFHLILRSICIIVAMCTSITLCILGIVKSHDGSIRSSYWAGVTTWLATLAGSWSAIPIVWQCWRLYNDDLGRTFQSSVNSRHAPSSGESNLKNSVHRKPSEERLDIRIELAAK
ncbi:hypothetical protein PGTUg99_023557 [Puccinia graminis f. sp. tritici]|uniref:Uncharacterized protein n=1 Tax=Puccinia graminis f. sp. tritici TaxID=56615 RepID=A0A5B0LXN1_PUCGR|nr:hypothetical protein PGTUg99_023557 [Puccinia graminis f. sp. tritici]